MSVAEAAGPSVDRTPTESAESDSGFFQHHFCDSKIVDKKWTAKCKLCSKNVSAVAGVNSNFRRHLKRHHPSEWANFFEEFESKKKAGQTTLTEIFQGPKLTESRMMMLDDAIVHMICVDEEPLTLTRKQGFKHFLKVRIIAIIVSLIAACYLLCALDSCTWYQDSRAHNRPL